MQEHFENKMTERFRMVLENYTPEYSPEAWERLRKSLPVKASRMDRLIQNIRTWISGIVITSAIIVVIKSDRTAFEKEPALSQFYPQSKVQHYTNSENRPVKVQSDLSRGKSVYSLTPEIKVNKSTIAPLSEGSSASTTQILNESHPATDNQQFVVTRDVTSLPESFFLISP